MQLIIRSLRALRAFAFASLVAAAAPACMDMDGTARMYLPGRDEDVPSRLTKDEARLIAESALIALNEADFEGFSASWDDALRAMVADSDFQKIRRDIVDEAGHFVEILDARKTSPVEGYVRFTFLCAFERGEIIYFLAFPQDGTEASAAFIGPPDE